MKRFVLILIIGAFALGLPLSVFSGSSEIQKIYEAAKKEGEVRYWTASDPDEVNIVIQKFEKKFPGIKVKHFEIPSPRASERVVLESKARRSSWDTFESSLPYILPVYERGLIERVNWTKLFGLAHSALVLDGLGVVTHHLPYAIIYNTNLISKEQAPKAWEDLLDPKWKGKIVVESRAGMFAGLAVSRGEEKADAFVQKLMTQNLLLLKGGTTILQTVGSGERHIGIGTYISKVPFWRKKGVATEWCKISPITGSTYGIFIPKNPMHPNAAKLFCAFYGTQEGQNALEDACYKANILPGSGSILAAELQKEGLEIIVTDTAKKAQRDIALQRKYAKMLGAVR